MPCGNHLGEEIQKLDYGLVLDVVCNFGHAGLRIVKNRFCLVQPFRFLCLSDFLFPAWVK